MKKLKIIWKIILPVIATCAVVGTGYKVYRNRVAAEEKSAKDTVSFFRCALKPGKDILEYSPDSKIDVMSLVDAGNGKEEYSYQSRQTLESDHSDFSVTAAPETIDLSVPGEIKVVYTLHDVDDYGKKVSKDFSFNIAVKDTQFPVITVNAETISIETGDDFDPVSLIASVKDPVDGDLEKVDAEPEKKDNGFYDQGWYFITSNVDSSKEGEYTVNIHAVDKNGNAAPDMNIPVYVKKSGTQVQQTASHDVVTDTGSNTIVSAGDTGSEQLNQMADGVLSGIINDSMSDYEKCYAIYQWTENNIRYKATDDSSSWQDAAIYGLTYYTGDCYNYYAVGRGLLCRAGFETQECKFPNDGHFWVKVLYDGQWLNWDATTGWGAERFLWTDDQLYSYSYTNPSNGYTISYNY